jgi:hypothetical protein
MIKVEVIVPIVFGEWEEIINFRVDEVEFLTVEEVNLPRGGNDQSPR